MLFHNLNAKAELHRLEQMQSEPRISPKYLRDSTLVSLVNEVMAMRPIDRHLYSITVGKKVYEAGAIEELYRSSSFSKG